MPIAPSHIIRRRGRFAVLSLAKNDIDPCAASNGVIMIEDLRWGDLMY